MGIPARKEDHIFTYGEYKTWPDDERWELIEGTAYNMSPAPRRSHQDLSAYIFVKMYSFLENKPCRAYSAPFDVLFPIPGNRDMDSVTSVVQPDISVICDKNKLIEQGCFGAPDLVVEILSPSTSKKDLNEKFNLFEKHGVKEYWVVDPRGQFLRIYRLRDNGTYDDGALFDILAEKERPLIAESSVLKGFSLDVRALFNY